MGVCLCITRLVRHPLPLALFRLFVEPFASKIVVEDGKTSFQRSYTAGELRQITAGALVGSGATFQQSVGPFCLRQVMDISYKSDGSSLDREGASNETDGPESLAAIPSA